MTAKPPEHDPFAERKRVECLDETEGEQEHAAGQDDRIKTRLRHEVVSVRIRLQSAGFHRASRLLVKVWRCPSMPKKA